MKQSFKIVFRDPRTGLEVSPFKTVLPWGVAFRALLRHRKAYNHSRFQPVIAPV